MFYCDGCAQAKNWPVTGFTSIGPCETCGQKAACYEVPAVMLPGDAVPFGQRSYQVSSYGRAGADSLVHERVLERAAAEKACRLLVEQNGREGAYVRRFPDNKIVHHFDHHDLDGG